MSLGPRITREGARRRLNPPRTRCSTDSSRASTALRVPAASRCSWRFGLAGLVAIGVAAIGDDRRRRLVALVAGALIAIEFVRRADSRSTTTRPTTRSRVSRRCRTPSNAGARRAAGLSLHRQPAASSAVILELPLGEPAFDIRYMFYSTLHWKPLVNGYSGGEPPDYELLDTSLQDVTTRPDRAWQALLDSRATHVVVHEALFAAR